NRADASAPSLDFPAERVVGKWPREERTGRGQLTVVIQCSRGLIPSRAPFQLASVKSVPGAELILVTLSRVADSGPLRHGQMVQCGADGLAATADAIGRAQDDGSGRQTWPVPVFTPAANSWRTPPWHPTRDHPRGVQQV